MTKSPVVLTLILNQSRVRRGSYLAVAALGEDAFESVGARGFEHGVAVGREVVGEADVIGGREDFREQALAVFEAHAAQVVTVEIEQIEEEQRDWSGARQVRDAVGVGDRDARLDEAEARAAVFVEHRDLAVENGGGRFEEVRQDAELGILLVAALLVAREDAELALLDEADGADAVPFHFVEPVGARRRASGESGEHGLDGAGQRGFRRRRAASRAIAGGGSCRFVDGGKVVGDFLLGAAGEHAARVVLDVPAGFRGGVLLLDEQPLVALAAIFHADQGEFAGELFAVQAELEIAALDLGLAGCVAEQIEGAAVPEHHAAAAVLAFGDVAFEISVVERMIFDVDGEGFGERLKRGAFGDGPGFERAVDFEAEVVVQARGVVALDAEEISGGRLTAGGAGLGSGVLSNDRLRSYSLSDMRAR